MGNWALWGPDTGPDSMWQTQRHTAVAEVVPHDRSVGYSRDVLDLKMAVVAGWTDAAHALRAVQHLDTELRRCATAWAAVFKESEDSLDGQTFEPYAWFVEALGPRVPASSSGGLAIRAMRASPCTYLLEPVGDLRQVMCSALTTSLVHSMWAFNVHIVTSVHDGCGLAGAMTLDCDVQLAALASQIHDGAGVGGGRERKRWSSAQAHRPALQTVGRSPAASGGGWGLSVVVWRRFRAGHEDLVKSTLLPG